MARATLDDGRLDDVKVIFHQEGPLSSGNHFGCRIAQSADFDERLSDVGPSDGAACELLHALPRHAGAVGLEHASHPLRPGRAGVAQLPSTLRDGST